MSQQSGKASTRRSALDAQAALRKERADHRHDNRGRQRSCRATRRDRRRRGRETHPGTRECPAGSEPLGTPLGGAHHVGQPHRLALVETASQLRAGPSQPTLSHGDRSAVDLSRPSSRVRSQFEDHDPHHQFPSAHAAFGCHRSRDRRTTPLYTDSVGRKRHR
jgi:hypothetical protein